MDICDMCGQAVQPTVVNAGAVVDALVGQTIREVSFVQGHALRITCENGAELQVAAYHEQGVATAAHLGAALLRPERIRYQVEVTREAVDHA
jgi:hypothetical protein